MENVDALKKHYKNLIGNFVRTHTSNYILHNSIPSHSYTR